MSLILESLAVFVKLYYMKIILFLIICSIASQNHNTILDEVSDSKLPSRILPQDEVHGLRIYFHYTNRDYANITVVNSIDSVNAIARQYFRKLLKVSNLKAHRTRFRGSSQ